MDELTEKQKRFCEEFMIDLNGTQAAIRAGYSENSANVIASQNLSKLNVQQYLSELKQKRAESLNIDNQWVLKRFIDISERCMQAEPVLINENGQWVESGEYKFDASNANKATEMIGKHLGFFEKDNNQLKPKQTTVINLGSGVKPNESID